MATINVNETTARQLQELAASQGMSIDEYVQSLVPKANQGAAISCDEFEAQVETLSFHGPSLPVDFSRADIFFRSRLMKYLVDTGVLLRLFDSDDPHCASIRTAFRVLRENRDQLFFAVQNASEFWNVSTRPTSARGGYGHDNQRVSLRLQLLERFCSRVVETHASYEKWKQLLVIHSISGVAVHDARLVSIMVCSGISQLVTLNARDFDRFAEIDAIVPGEIVARGSNS